MAHQVVLTWQVPDDATASASYNVYRTGSLCPASGLGGLVFSKVNTAPITALTFTDSSVQVGKSYCYYGTHVEGTVESIPSNTAGGTVTPHTIIIQMALQ